MNAKKIVERLKIALDVETNINLAKKLDVQYSTLNAWIQRNSMPMQAIISKP